MRAPVICNPFASWVGRAHALPLAPRFGRGRPRDSRHVELAILRGRRDLIGVLDTLQPRQEGQGDPSGLVPPEWRALLDR